MDKIRCRHCIHCTKLSKARAAAIIRRESDPIAPFPVEKWGLCNRPSAVGRSEYHRLVDINFEWNCREYDDVPIYVKDWKEKLNEISHAPEAGS